MLLTLARSALSHELEWLAGQALSQLLRICNRRRRTDELGCASIECADASDATEKIRQVAAKDAAVGMQFVNDNKFEVFEQLRPLGVMRKDALVEHVRITQDHVTVGADCGTGVLGSVSVVGIHSDASGGRQSVRPLHEVV